MICPSAEVLSRWIDGLVPGDKTAAHLHKCSACAAKVAELKAAGAWLKRVAAPGAGCLTPDEMALAIGGRRFPHFETCPRCAAELRDLKPRKTTAKLRIVRPRRNWMPLIAAAAALLVALIVAVIATRTPEETIAKSEPKKIPPPIEPIPDLPRPAPKPEPEAPKPVPPEPTPEPKPVPKPEEPKPEPPKPEEPKPEPVKPTVPEEPARTEAAFALKSGALSTLENGKWVKPAKVFDGMALRADGRTRLDFAGAMLTLDATTKFSLAKSEFSLTSGALTADVPAGSKFSLVLGTSAVHPQATTSRVLLTARDNQVVIEEGSAKSGGTLLGEGEQFESKEGRLAPRKSRTIALAARSRELATWTLEIQNNNATRGKLPEGKLGPHPGGGRVLSSTPYENAVYAASLRWFAGGDYDTFTVKPTTAVRFRYFLKEPTNLRFSMRNRTKDENFGIDLDPVIGKWTTVTLQVDAIPVYKGGRKVMCETGDKYGWFGWNIGKPGDKVEILVDQFEVLEIEK